MPDSASRPPYSPPRYRAPVDAVWYHVLHGTVPGHQIDFMYCADVPQGPLTQTHFAHVSRLMKYIEPRERAPFAFAIGNLSRDDVQHEPGHGALALIFGLRVEGVVDHAGRSMPPYAHGVIAVDRAFDHRTLLDAASAFFRGVEREGLADASRSFYRAYADAVRRDPDSVEDLLRRYVRAFDTLPQPRPSDFSWKWVAGDATLPGNIIIVHADDAPFGTIAQAAAQIGAMLYCSNIKWTIISTGRELDIPGGLSIRFVPGSQAPLDPKGRMVRIEDVPDDEAELARALFGAKATAALAPAARIGWREHASAGPREVIGAPRRRALWIGIAGGASVCAIAAAFAARSGHAPPASTEAPVASSSAGLVSSPSTATTTPVEAPLEAPATTESPAPPPATTGRPPGSPGKAQPRASKQERPASTATLIPSEPSPPTPSKAGQVVGGPPQF